MKKLLLLLLTINATFTMNAQIVTPQPSPSSKLEQKVGLTDVTLEYSRKGNNWHYACKTDRKQY